MMEYIINLHKDIIGEENYEIIDPELKSNNIKGIIPSQTDIIYHILTNNLDIIQIKYKNQYKIQYKIQYSQIEANKIKLSPLEPNSVHLLRLIGNNLIPKYSYEFDLEVNQDFFPDIIIVINSYMDKKKCSMDYCSVCGCELKLKGMRKISHCGTELCSTRSKHLVMDNIITDLYKKDPYLCEILIDILVQGTTHPKEEKIFKPLPKINNVSNLQELKKILEKEKTNLDISHISKSSDDIELHRKIGDIAYSIISNAISDNYFSLNTIEKFQTEVLNRGVIRLENIESAFDSPNVKFIGLNYSYEVESKFSKEYFLFHGSGLSSWYPIVKNGLKVMSGTAMMANGAAYGSGIYFSDSFKMSLGYSMRGTTPTNGYGSQYVVGVFEILEDPIKWRKSHGIYVIDDEKVLLLRTLVLLNSCSGSLPQIDISNYFLKEIPLQKQTNKLNVGMLKNKRLEGEHKKLLSLDFLEFINIQDQWKWIVGFKKISEYTNISFEIIFSNYPINPPIIKLLNPDIKITNLIGLNDKTIKIDMINPSNWKITNNLSEIISTIYKCFQESL